MGSNKEEILRLLRQRQGQGQETDQERILRLLAEKRAQQGGTSTVVSSVPETAAAKEDNDRFFKAGAFSDGYQFGDITKTILGTAGDIGVNAVKGAGSLVEGVTDLLGYAGAGIADLFGADEFANDWKKSIQKNTVDALLKGVEDRVDKASVLGGRSDAISQGLGQVAAIILTGGAAGAAGGAAGLSGSALTALTTGVTTGVTGLSGMGSGMSQAYQEGATDGEAVAYGAIAGTAEALTEWIFAGMGKSVKALGFSKGLSSADDMLAKKLSSKISGQLGKNLVELGVKAGAEGTEEVLSGVVQAFGKKLTYLSEEELGKIVKDERLFDQFLTGAITSGIAQSGIVPGMKAGSFREANQTGRDLITGLTQNEQAVADKEFADRVAERKKSGELSKKQEAEIYDKVLEDMENGRISIDTIESVLGGDTYKGYQSMLEQEKALKDEIKTLVKTPKEQFTVEQSERLAEARKQLEGLDVKTAKSNLFSQVDKLTANDTKLRESYNERTRRGQAFTADLAKYDTKQQETVKRAIESGILNNTNRTHEFVDLIAKISANKGVSFNFADNAKLKESGFALDGKQVNGFVTADGVTININSAKALNSVVGHEITHVLEGTDLYNELQSAIVEYAKSKGDYQGRYDTLTELYKDIEGADIDAELTADLVGDYLFTDAEFVQRLSTEHRGVFQKLFDEIKHLCKLATAGTKEARELEKVKKLFEDAYRTETKNPTADGGVKYSIRLTESDTADYLRSGNRNNKSRQEAYDKGEQIILTSEAEIKEYIDNAINKEQGLNTVAYGKVNSRLSNEVSKNSKGAIEIANAYLELVPGDLQHAFEQHSEAKEDGDIPLTVEDFENIPEYLDNYTELLYAIKYASGRTHICVSKIVENGRILIIETVSKSRGSVQFKNAIGVTEEKYRNKYLPMYKKGSGVNTRGSQGSNTSLRDTTTSNNSILNPNEKVNGKFSLSGNEQTTAPAGGYRITGEDVALAPTKEDIAAQEIATAPAAPRNDVEELGAPTREDIARMDRDKKLKGPLLMKDSLDRELEKLYRLQQLNQIQDNAYFVELFKVNAAYQAAGRDFTEAFNRVVDAYQGDMVSSTADAVNEDAQRDERRLTDDDLADYMRVGIRKHVRDEKQKIVDAGDSPILTKPSDIVAFIRNALYGKEKDVVKAYGRANSKLAKAVSEATEGTVNIDDYYLELDANRIAHIKDHVGEDKDNRNIPLTEKQIEQIPAYVDNFDDLIDVIQRKDGSVRLMLGKKINGHSIIVETVSKGREALHPVTAYQVSTSDYISKYKTRAIDRSSTSRSANADTVDISRPATAPADTSIPKNSEVVNGVGNGVQEVTAPTREDILRMEAEKELHGPWRMTDELDQKVEKLYRMMLREEVNEEDYIAQLVKADKQYQLRGSRVEEALERVREAYSKETTETPETEKKMERLTRKVLHKGIMDRIRDALTKAGFDLNTILKNAKNLSTFATVDNTPQRVNEKTFGYKAGQIINDLTVNKAALNESDGIQWLNGQIDKIRKMSERYGIKPGSKESRAAQIYGEGFWVNEVGEYIQYGDAELAADFPDTEKQAKIKALAKSQEVRQMYDETLDAINAARVRNGYPPIPRRDNYFLHFRAQDDTFSKIGVPFNPNDVRAKDLPTDLNGVTADLKPGKPFFASEMKRTGDKTTYDLLGGLERYMNSAKNQIYHIDDIQTLRAMRNYIADMFGQANGLADLDSLSPEEQEQRIKEVFDNHLSTYAKFLNEEANIFAGKTALIDRGVEGVLGRRAIQFLHNLNGQVGKNMVGYNISSAGTNVLPVVQATAMLPKADMVKAFAQTISNKFRSDGFVESDPALIRRKGADQFTKTPWQRISDPGYALMSAVDNLSSELIVRAKYNELTRKGMDSQQAHIRAGEWASRLMGDRSLGQMPQLYNSKTLGLITKFQLEVRNQLDAMGYDVIQEAKTEEGASNAKKAAKVASTMAQLAIFQHLFGQAYESIAGYNPAFDIVENLIKLFGFDDEEESEDTLGDNVEQAFLGLLEDLPYTSTFTGGRIPIASALPVKEVITGKDSYGNEKDRLETLAGALPYYILPGGYGQAKKTVQGLKMFDEDLPVAGSYTDSGNLRFPVEEDSIADWLQAALFGQYASKNAREYFDNGWAPLKEKQIEEFASLEIPVADYREIRKQLGKLGTIGEKLAYIHTLDLPVSKKNILANNLTNREEPIDMAEWGNLDEFDYAVKYPEKAQFLIANGVSVVEYDSFDDETKAAYDWAYLNPEKYAVSKTVTDDIVTYRTYTKALSEIKADKDSAGKTVSGSRKKKVVQYINGLDAEYGAKLVLYKMEYPSDDTYNGKIIEYVNGIEGFTFEQKANVLVELGFTVAADGRVLWN